MKSLYVVLGVVVAIIVAFILFASFRKKENVVNEIFVRYEEDCVKYRMHLTEDSINSLGTTREITEVSNLSKFHQEYMGWCHEFLSSQLGYNNQMKKSVIILLRSVFNSLKIYLSKISKDNPNITFDQKLINQMELTKNQFDSAIENRIQEIGNNFKKNYKEKGIVLNKWHSLDLARLGQSISLLNDLKPLKITLLPEDERLFKESADVLLKEFNDKDTVIFINLKKDEELLRKQREFLVASFRFFIIIPPFHTILRELNPY